MLYDMSVIRQVNISFEYTLNDMVKASMDHDYDYCRWEWNELSSLVRHCQIFGLIDYCDMKEVIDEVRQSFHRIWEEYNS